MKGQTGIELAVLAIMGFIGVIALYFPPLVFPVTSQINIRYEYDYDNSQLLILSLLSTTVPDNLVNIIKPTIEIIGEYLQLQPQPDNSFITPVSKKLDLLMKAANLECYKLSAPDKDIVKTDCEPTKFKVAMNLPLPYKPGNLVKTITLVVGK